jgi:formylmethanofuran dehydrogenase subunit B
MPSVPQTPVEMLDVACPFCGLVCDDLVVRNEAGRLSVRANGCPIAIAGFARAPLTGQARIGVRPVDRSEAIDEAARLLAAAKLPLLGGLATDVAGIRAAASLADRIGGVLDHMNSAASMRNMLVLQDGGWVITTLSEVRNRADLLVVAGGDNSRRFTRFLERCIAKTADGSARSSSSGVNSPRERRRPARPR